MLDGCPVARSAVAHPASDDHGAPARRAGWHGICRLLPVGMVSLLVVGGCGPRDPRPWQPASRTVVWPAPPAPPRVRYEGSITSGQALRFASTTGSRLLDLLVGRPRMHLGAPHGLAASATLIAVADSGTGAVHVLELAKRRYRVLASVGDVPLGCPVGLAAGGQGDLFVADAALARVFHLATTGQLLGEVREKFIRPTGVVYDAPRQRLHIVDSGAHALLTFRHEQGGWTLARRLGGRGEEEGLFNFPTHAAVDRDGSLYVADSLNHRIQRFDAEGRLLGSFGQAGDGTGDFAKAKGVAVDSEGHVYVADSLYDVVQIFDRDGRFLLSFGGSGREHESLWLPTGIFIDEEDRIYVADTGNARVQVYQYLRESR
ncbi:MAG: 6-bladed beta-propeller [Planctomycetes bacterium]|nr:6-bladed beta-propeller [Planctomycetota bacterium]